MYTYIVRSIKTPFITRDYYILYFLQRNIYCKLSIFNMLRRFFVKKINKQIFIFEMECKIQDI